MPLGVPLGPTADRERLVAAGLHRRGERVYDGDMIDLSTTHGFFWWRSV